MKDAEPTLAPSTVMDPVTALAPDGHVVLAEEDLVHPVPHHRFAGGPPGPGGRNHRRGTGGRVLRGRDLGQGQRLGGGSLDEVDVDVGAPHHDQRGQDEHSHHAAEDPGQGGALLLGLRIGHTVPFRAAVAASDPSVSTTSTSSGSVGFHGVGRSPRRRVPRRRLLGVPGVGFHGVGFHGVQNVGNDREGDGHGHAAAGGRLGRDGAAVGEDDGRDDGESKARTTVVPPRAGSDR